MFHDYFIFIAHIVTKSCKLFDDKTCVECGVRFVNNRKGVWSGSYQHFFLVYFIAYNLFSIKYTFKQKNSNNIYDICNEFTLRIRRIVDPSIICIYPNYLDRPSLEEGCRFPRFFLNFLDREVKQSGNRIWPKIQLLISALFR